MQADPTTMAGYRYFVWGENAQDLVSKACPGRLTIDAINAGKCITLEKIWQSRGRLLHSWDKQKRIKDVCLSYALYKILHCQLDGISLTPECYRKMQVQRLIFRGILHEEEDDGRVFRIFKVEIAFLNDYQKTRYPIVIWYGFPVINLVTFFMTSFVALFLATKLG